jgi:hypothetical protein
MQHISAFYRYETLIAAFIDIEPYQRIYGDMIRLSAHFIKKHLPTLAALIFQH